VACGLGEGKGRGIAVFCVVVAALKVVEAVVDGVRECDLAGGGDERSCG
jgi:hypothetical protein